MSTGARNAYNKAVAGDAGYAVDISGPPKKDASPASIYAPFNAIPCPERVSRLWPVSTAITVHAGDAGNAGYLSYYVGKMSGRQITSGDGNRPRITRITRDRLRRCQMGGSFLAYSLAGNSHRGISLGCRRHAYATLNTHPALAADRARMMSAALSDDFTATARSGLTWPMLSARAEPTTWQSASLPYARRANREGRGMQSIQSLQRDKDMTDTETLDEAAIMDLANIMSATADDSGFLEPFRLFSRDAAATLRACLRGEVAPDEAQYTAQAWVDLAKLETARRDRIGELSAQLQATADPSEWRDLLIEVAGLMSDGHITEIMADFHLELGTAVVVDLPDDLSDVLVHAIPDGVH